MKGFFIKASGLLMLGWLASVASAEGQLAASAVPANQPAPPEIKLNGLTTILGDKRALFKARPDYGEPASYFLAEGQSAGGIQLLAVDIRAGKIKVNNHGVVQVIVLCQPPDLSTVTAYPDTGASRIILTQTYGINSPDGLSPVLPPTMGTAGQNIFAGNPGGMAQAVNGGGSPGAGSSDSGSGASDPGTAGSDNNSQKPVPYSLTAAREFERLRIQTAAGVYSGTQEPIPLTPLTPPGTPRALIGPERAWFPD